MRVMESSLNKASETEFVHEDVLNPCPLCKDGDGFCTGICGDECEECEFIKTRSEQDLKQHIMNDHEPSKVFHNFGRNWVTIHKNLISRNMDFAQDCKHWEK